MLELSHALFWTFNNIHFYILFYNTKYHMNSLMTHMHTVIIFPPFQCTGYIGMFFLFKVWHYDMSLNILLRIVVKRSDRCTGSMVFLGSVLLISQKIMVFFPVTCTSHSHIFKTIESEDLSTMDTTLPPLRHLVYLSVPTL